MAFDLQLEVAGKRYRDAERGLDALSRRLGVAFTDLTPIAQREMQDILDTVREALRQRHGSRWRAGQRLPTGDRLGRLARRRGSVDQIRAVVTRSRDEVLGKLDVPFPLSVHERGAIVRARRAKYLTIPLPEALDSRGVPLKRRARDWQNTFVARSRNGNLLIFQRRGREIVPLYLLKKSVKLPRRLGARVTLDKAAPLFIDRLFDSALRQLRRSI